MGQFGLVSVSLRRLYVMRGKDAEAQGQIQWAHAPVTASTPCFWGNIRFGPQEMNDSAMFADGQVEVEVKGEFGTNNLVRLRSLSSF